MQYVGVGRRFVAVLIDSIILGAAGAPLADFQRVQTSYGSSYSINYHGGAFFGLLGIWLVYYTVMEATLGGTAGKLAMGIRVVQEDGSKCTWQGAIVRNLLRIIDGFFVYLVAAILVWSSSTRQRLGDRAADTVVILKGTNAGMGGAASASNMSWPNQPPVGGVAMPPPPPPPPVGPPGSGLGDQPIQ